MFISLVAQRRTDHPINAPQRTSSSSKDIVHSHPLPVTCGSPRHGEEGRALLGRGSPQVSRRDSNPPRTRACARTHHLPPPFPRMRTPPCPPKCTHAPSPSITHAHAHTRHPSSGRPSPPLPPRRCRRAAIPPRRCLAAAAPAPPSTHLITLPLPFPCRAGCCQPLTHLHTSRVIAFEAGSGMWSELVRRTHARTHAHMHACEHARTHARMHAGTHACAATARPSTSCLGVVIALVRICA